MIAEARNSFNIFAGSCIGKTRSEPNIPKYVYVSFVIDKNVCNF